MSWPLVAALAAAGLATGWCLRPVVFRMAVPAGEPPRAGCPGCGHRIAARGRGHRIAARGRGQAASPPGGAAAACARPTQGGPGRAARPGRAATDAPPAGQPHAGPATLLRLRDAAPPPARCPACRARLGPPPLALALPTAILLGALATRVHPGLVLAAACWLAVCAVALAWTDAAVHRLPDVLTAAAYAGTAGLLLLAAAAGGHWRNLLGALLGGLALAAAYLALAVISRSAVGLGDAKLAASLGTMLAWAGWPALIAGTFVGFLLAAVYGLGLLLARRATLKQRIPFGPFMIVGAFLALLAAI